MGYIIWGYNPLIQTIDPNFQRDIEVDIVWVEHNVNIKRLCVFRVECLSRESFKPFGHKKTRIQMWLFSACMLNVRV